MQAMLPNFGLLDGNGHSTITASITLLFDCITSIAGRPIEHPKRFSAMEYKQFVVRAFEREPGKWRACIKRANGKAIMARLDHRLKLAKFTTGVDAKSAQAAMLMAMAAIDADAFSKYPEEGDGQAG
jgi:hypothetical protein